jgi:hypothetical protein
MVTEYFGDVRTFGVSLDYRPEEKPREPPAALSLLGFHGSDTCSS